MIRCIMCNHDIGFVPDTTKGRFEDARFIGLKENKDGFKWLFLCYDRTCTKDWKEKPIEDKLKLLEHK